MPPAIAALPRNKAGYPVPWFAYVDDHGVPDFRVVRAHGIPDAVRFELCWICGKQRGRHAAFVLGPMCGVNRVSAEPPSHLECARYAAQACPFLATPSMHRRERGIEEHLPPAGLMLERNPGVALVWSSRTWKRFSTPLGSLFDVGEPTQTSWWAHGRPATPEEVRASIESGLPVLREIAAQEPGGLENLERDLQRALATLPILEGAR